MVHALCMVLAVAVIVTAGPNRAAVAGDETARAWDALRGDGYIAVIRHSAAPGGAGDPAGFKLDDCATQRNLSEEGRAQARALGERFRAERVKVAKLITSEWCRCRQTAELMNIGAAEDAPAFNNAFVLSGQRDTLTHGARATLSGWRGPGTLVVVTHGANIQALLGIHPQEGEVVVVKPNPGGETIMRVVGRIRP